MPKTLDDSNRYVTETSLVPRFYTTDFEEKGNLNISSNIGEFNAVLQEFRADYNKQNFIRDQKSDPSWNHLVHNAKAFFIEFLERSCAAEFSGILLNDESSRRLEKNSYYCRMVFINFQG